MKKLKGSTLLVVFVILLFLLVAGYRFRQRDNSEIIDTNNPTPSPEVTISSPTPTLTTDEETPSDWKTFTSETYDYEFRYPPEATLNERSQNYIGVSYMGEKQRASGRTQTELADGYAFNVVVVTEEDFEDLDDFNSQRVDQLKETCTSVGDPQETTVDGKRAISHELSCLGDYDTYYVQNDDTYFEISLLHVGDEEDLPGYTETVNQIFSTFEFSN